MRLRGFCALACGAALVAIAPAVASAKVCGRVYVPTRGLKAKVRVVVGPNSCGTAHRVVAAAFKAEDTRSPDAEDPSAGREWDVLGWRCATGLAGSQTFCARGRHRIDGSFRRDDDWAFATLRRPNSSTVGSQATLSIARAATVVTDLTAIEAAGIARTPNRSDVVYEVAPPDGCCTREGANVGAFDEVLATSPTGDGWSITVEYDFTWRLKEEPNGTIEPTITNAETERIGKRFHASPTNRDSRYMLRGSGVRWRRP
jgi:hypothetical protein